MQKISVVIIGTGLAGLTAAYELSKDKRFDITLLEKDSHLGGRVHSINVNTTSVDVGGFIVYPWYKNFRRIVEDLRITKKLTPLPKLNVLYGLSREMSFIPEEDIPLSAATKGRMAAKLLPAFLNNLDVAHPQIERFEDMSVSTFLANGITAVNDASLENYIDIICQGYCYAPISEYRAAFMLPMMGNNLFFGDIRTADYFQKGMQEMIRALEKNLVKNGVHIQKDTAVTKITPHKVTTKAHTFSADAIVVSHPIDTSIPFTRFVTVTVACSGALTVNGTNSWGALFLHPKTCTAPNILSVIHTEHLYGKKLKNTLTLNIKLSEKERVPTANATYEKAIATELKKIFPELTKTTITSYTFWNHTMPVSDEKTILALRERQGKDGIYFAGDYMGCPSMETAVSTGIDAAKMIKGKQW